MRRLLAALAALSLLIVTTMPVTAANPQNTIVPIRDGSNVSASWSAQERYDYLWASVDCPGYAVWQAARSESWTDLLLEWSDVPAVECTATLWYPHMAGDHRIWKAIASATF